MNIYIKEGPNSYRLVDPEEKPKASQVIAAALSILLWAVIGAYVVAYFIGSVP